MGGGEVRHLDLSRTVLDVHATENLGSCTHLTHLDLRCPPPPQKIYINKLFVLSTSLKTRNFARFIIWATANVEKCF